MEEESRTLLGTGSERREPEPSESQLILSDRELDQCPRHRPLRVPRPQCFLLEGSVRCFLAAPALQGQGHSRRSHCRPGAPERDQGRRAEMKSFLPRGGDRPISAEPRKGYCGLPGKPPGGQVRVGFCCPPWAQEASKDSVGGVD